jgi:hypothetical protein
MNLCSAEYSGKEPESHPVVSSRLEAIAIDHEQNAVVRVDEVCVWNQLRCRCSCIVVSPQDRPLNGNIGEPSLVKRQQFEVDLTRYGFWPSVGINCDVLRWA